MAIAALVGSPLCPDASTRNLKRPSLARIQVEIDLLKPRLDKIWIAVEDGDGFWQKIEYEDVPDYCQYCWHVGHSELECTVHNPELKAVVNRPDKKLKQKYVEKQKPSTDAGPSGTVTVPEGPAKGVPFLTLELPSVEAEPVSKKDVSQDEPSADVNLLHNNTVITNPNLEILYNHNQQIELSDNESVEEIQVDVLPAGSDPKLDVISAGILQTSMMKPHMSGQDLNLTREAIFIDLRAYNVSLQQYKGRFTGELETDTALLNTLEQSKPSSNIPTMPKKRGRPRKNFFDMSKQLHPMVTRSSSLPLSQ